MVPRETPRWTTSASPFALIVTGPPARSAIPRATVPIRSHPNVRVAASPHSLVREVVPGDAAPKRWSGAVVLLVAAAVSSPADTGRRPSHLKLGSDRAPRPSLVEQLAAVVDSPGLNRSRSGTLSVDVGQALPRRVPRETKHGAGAEHVPRPRSVWRSAGAGTGPHSREHAPAAYRQVLKGDRAWWLEHRRPNTGS